MSPRWTTAASAEVLGVFAKAPVPGLVKTRLASAIGAAEAAALYRRIGRAVVGAAAATRPTVVWYAPRGRRADMTAWLPDVHPIQYRVQSAGGLGCRLAGAFAWHFAQRAERVVIIGTDCPGIERRVLERAFQALRSADLVLGPATDGGYYLVGLRAPQPMLFRDMPWSTDLVFRTTLDRARAIGCSCRALRRLRDLDTLRDALALGLLPAARGGQDL